MSYELKQIKILGYTTDYNVCDCCGKENLKGTITILDLIYDTVLHFGTTCAVSADKYDSLAALNEAKKSVNSLKREIQLDTQFVETMIRKFNIEVSKKSNLLKAYLSFRSIRENRIKRFNWESWA